MVSGFTNLCNAITGLTTSLNNVFSYLDNDIRLNNKFQTNISLTNRVDSSFVSF